MPFRDSWILVGLLLVAIGLGAGEAVIAGVGFVVMLLGAATRYWSRHLWDRVEFRTRLAEKRAFVGENVELEVTLANKKPLPLPWFEWRLPLSDQLEVPGEGLAASAAPGESWLVRRGAMGWYERQAWTFTVGQETAATQKPSRCWNRSPAEPPTVACTAVMRRCCAAWAGA